MPNVSTRLLLAESSLASNTELSPDSRTVVSSMRKLGNISSPPLEERKARRFSGSPRVSSSPKTGQFLSRKHKGRIIFAETKADLCRTGFFIEIEARTGHSGDSVMLHQFARK